MSGNIGFDRKIRRDWLDRLLDHLVEDADPGRAREYLHEMLRPDHPGEAARTKSVSVLLQIWVQVPKPRRPVQARALELARLVTARERLWLHWGMTLQAYALARDTAGHAGRLLALQETVSLSQIQSRLIKGWGDRSTLKRASQRVVSSLVDWGVLTGEETGQYAAAPKLATESKPLQLWLLEAMISAGESREVEAGQLLGLPTLFPFALGVGLGELRASERFEVHRQGLDMEMVVLKPEPLTTAREAPPRRRPARQPSLLGIEPDGEDVRRSRKATTPKRATAGKAAGRARDAGLSRLVESFTSQLEECRRLHDQGFLHGCIALAQVATEGAVRHLWVLCCKKRKASVGEPGKNLKELLARGHLDAGEIGRIGAICSAAKDARRGELLMADRDRLEQIGATGLDSLEAVVEKIRHLHRQRGETHLERRGN